MPVGTSSRDFLIGTPEADRLEALSDNDTVLGLDGDDTAYGHDDDDWMAGNSGRDRLSGDKGNDILYGGQGNDTLIGGSDSFLSDDRDRDFLSGDLGDDLLLGDLGDDTLAGGDERDILFGNRGNDLLFGNLEADFLHGGKGNDSLYGGKGNDWLYGDLGNDYLAGERGIDTLEGGAGTDTFVVGKTADPASEANPDLILDFRRREDFIQLADGLRFDDLTFIAGTGDRIGSTILQDRHTGENLAILVGIRPEDLDRFDFRDDSSLPSTPPTPHPDSDPTDGGSGGSSGSDSGNDDSGSTDPDSDPTDGGSGGSSGSDSGNDNSGSTDPDSDPTDGGSGGSSGSDSGNDDSGSTDPDDDPTETNQPPTFTSTANTQATQGVEYTYNIVAVDPDLGDNLTITAVNLPDWLTLTDNGSGTATLAGIPDGGDLGTPEIVLRVSDGQNLDVEQRFTVTVVGENSTFSYANKTRGIIANLNEGVGFTPKYEASKSNPLKIMPLGDSITQGKINNNLTPDADQSNREGYRGYLWEKLTNLGLEIDFVGSQSSGTDRLPDQDHEGHPGWKINQITAEVNNWLVKDRPDVILLKIGTNDSGGRVDTMAANLNQLVDRIISNGSFSGNLLVSTIPPTNQNSTYADRIDNIREYNSRIPGIVNSKPVNEKVYFVDIWSGENKITTDDISGRTDGDNGFHPKIQGYQKIAQFWYDAIIDSVRNNPDENLQNIDNVTGSAFGDILIGNADTNVLDGGGGDDKLTGGAGADNLTGGGGVDTFVYKNPNDGLDTITDFKDDDIFQISASGFGGGLVAGTQLQTTMAATGSFVSGNSPGYLGAVAHFLYDTATGILSFDADGNGGESNPVELARLSGAPALSANQLAIVA